MTPGGTAAVQMILPEGARPDSYYKLDSPTGEPSRFDFDGTTGAVISGNVVTLYLQDGGRGDADGLANGIIVDPGGSGNGGRIEIPSTGWTVFESGGTPTGKGTVTQDALGFVIREGDSFVVGIDLRRSHEPGNPDVHLRQPLLRHDRSRFD